MRDILYPYALDHSGGVVEAERADRNGWFTCIGCGERVILKRGEIKVAHFAHWREVEGCGGETVLHKMAKAAIKYGIERAIKEKRAYGFSWVCSVCKMEHWGDLAISEREIRVEAELNGVRPDLLAVSEKGKPLVAVEVIVSHSPEPEAVETYKRVRLPVVLVPVGWDGLRGLSRELGRREVVNAPCRAGRCGRCKGAMMLVKVGIWEGFPCWSCGRKMRLLIALEDDGKMSMHIPRGFVRVAGKIGIKLANTYSLLENKVYPMNVCPNCGARQGDNLIYHEVGYNKLPERYRPHEIEEYYKCEMCGRVEAKERVAVESATPRKINPPVKGGRTDATKTNTS